MFSFLLCTLYMLFFFPFPVLEAGGLRLDMGLPQWTCLCACLNSVLKPEIVLASSGDEFCNTSTSSFAFNPGRIKVLQFPKWSFCSRFSHKATALSLRCSCSLLSDEAGSRNWAARLLSLVKQKIMSHSAQKASLDRSMLYTWLGEISYTKCSLFGIGRLLQA